MIRDLRFVFGAVIATALLGITLFGLGAAMHLTYQSKVGPLETSRLLAYSPDGQFHINRATPRRDNPFASIPAEPNPVLLQDPNSPAAPSITPLQQAAEPVEQSPASVGQQNEALETPAQQAELIEPPLQRAEPVETRLKVAAAANAESEDLTPAGDPDTVDERAVIDPPLPLDDAPESAADTAAESAADTAAQSEPTATPPEATLAPAATLAEPAAAIHAPEATEAPIETTTAAPAPAIESPAQPEVAPDVQQVGSIPTGSDARGDGPAATVPAIIETPASAKAKAKRKPVVRKAAAKSKRPARRTIRPAARTGYSVNAPSTNLPNWGFWPTE